MGTVNSFIKNQPFLVKKMYYDLVPFEYRYGNTFRKTYYDIMQNLDMDTERLREKQFLELRNLLIHCYKHVPYYQKIFAEYSFNPFIMQKPEDINVLPYLTKDIINSNYEELIATNFKNKKLHILKTSGSTGTKLSFLADDDVYKKEAAFILRSYKLHGATLYDRPSIWLRRYVPHNSSSPLFYYDHELRRLYMSAYHLNENTIESYLQEIGKRRYHTLVGYPSSVYSLACLLEETNNGIDIQAIHTASEMMLPQWRQKINDIFGIKVKSHYGQMEKVALLIQNNEDEKYYDCLDYSYNEFLNEEEENVIVGTGFLNYVMPFVRYRTNDTVQMSNLDIKTQFGFPKYIEQVNGRSDDILISTHGSRIPGVNFYTMMYKIAGVKMFQIVQKEKDFVEFKMVKNEHFTDDTIKDIKRGLLERLGDVRIEFIVLDSIERNQNTGKIRCIFNEIQQKS